MKATRDWHTRAVVRALKTVRVGSVDPMRERTFHAGQEYELIQWGRAGSKVERTSWWTSYDIDAAFILNADEVEVVRVLDEVSPDPGDEE